MGKKDAKCDQTTSELNDEPVIHDSYGRCGGSGGSGKDRDDEMTVQEIICRSKVKKGNGSNGRQSDNEMTMQELVCRSKVKKHKVSNSTDSYRDDDANSTYWKPAIVPIEEEPDSEQFMSYQTARLLKQRQIENGSLTVAKPMALPKCRHLDFVGGDICGLKTTKTVNAEKNPSVLPTSSCLVDSAATFCSDNMDLLHGSSLRFLDSVNANKLDSKSSTAISEHLGKLLESESVYEKQLKMTEKPSFRHEVLNCSLNQAFMDTEEATSFLVNLLDEFPDDSDSEMLEMIATSSFNEPTLSSNETSTRYVEQTGESTSCLAHAELCSDSWNGLLDRTDRIELDDGEPTFSFVNELLHCCVNEASTDHMEVVKDSAYSEAELTSPRISFDSTLYNGELEREEIPSSEVEDLYYSDDASNNCLEPGSEVSGNNGDLSTSRHALCQMQSDSNAQASNTTRNDSLQRVELNGQSNECISVLESGSMGMADKISTDSEMPADDTKENNSTDVEDHSIGDTNVQCSSLHGSHDTVGTFVKFPSSDDHAPASGGMLSSSVSKQTPPVSSSETKSSCGSYPSHYTKGAIGSSDNIHSEKQACPLEMPLSNRECECLQVPEASEEKLPQDTHTDELLRSIDISTYQRRLWFERHTRASKTGASLQGFQVSRDQNRPFKKLASIDRESLQYANGVFSSSIYAESTCTECSSNLSNAQKAVRFSVRQIHDMECFVMKLMKEFKYMESIMEENICSQLCHSTTSPLKDRNGEMRKIAFHTVKLEETTRHWHYVMLKDWNRFCRIMGMSNEEPMDSSVHNRQRKVRFADEAGGILCNKKVFRKHAAPMTLQG